MVSRGTIESLTDPGKFKAQMPGYEQELSIEYQRCKELTL